MSPLLPDDLRALIRRKQPENPVIHGWASYAQFDEDGIVRHCLEKIASVSPLSKTAVEVGCGDGRENCTHQLLLEGYSAVWVDGSASHIDSIVQQLGALVFPRLWALREHVGTHNADAIALDAASFLGAYSVDFFSLDIDGNDLHVCAPFVQRLKPKLVCVEYNAKFPPPVSMVMDLNPQHQWVGDDYFGASLQAWVDFFAPLEYTLVCCNLTGVNAFFVHQLFAKLFHAVSPVDLYMPARYGLIGSEKGHCSSLKWLKQTLCQKHALAQQQVDDEPAIVVAEAKYGKMLVYRDDQVIGRSLRETGTFQEDKISVVVDFLKAGFNFQPDLFVDIGANIGTHSIYALEKCGFQRVLAFEPDPGNIKLLRKNFAIHRCAERSELHAVALSSHTGICELELSAFNYGDHRVKPFAPAPVSFGEEMDRVTVQVQSITLDDWQSEHLIDWSAALVWMDTQGHEGHIFKGGEQFFASSKGPRFMLTEFWPYGIERSGAKYLYCDFLRRCSAVYDVNDPLWITGKKVSLVELEEMYDRMLCNTQKEHHPHTDLLLIKNIDGPTRI